MKYIVEDKDLVIRDTVGKELWRGRPEGYEVEWASTIPSSDDGIVLYHYFRPERTYGGFDNLVRIRPNGSIVWHAQTPSSDDKYVYATLRDNRLLANSYGGFQVQVDLDTGRIVEQKFTK